MPRTALAVGLLWLSTLLGPATAGAELYQWTDRQGRVHITDDLTRVPAGVRVRAQDPPDDAGGERESDPAAGTPAAPAPPARPDRGPSERELAHKTLRALQEPGKLERHVIPVARAGVELSVQATVNNRLEVPFKVDTGASISTIPRSVAIELGLDLESAGSIVVVGIGGEPMLVPLVTLQEVRLGTAVVEQVEAAVLDTMAYGLLGMPFFNHFRVEIDPTEGAVTLEEVDLDGIDGIYGGHDEEYWRSRYRLVHEQLERIEGYREQVPDEYGWIHDRIDRAWMFWQEQQDGLDQRATVAGVPTAWRE